MQRFPQEARASRIPRMELAAGRWQFAVLRGWPGLAIGGVALLLASGCTVPQPRGEGTLERLVEPTRKASYWRYLPKDYVQASETARAQRRWPVVVSFHGMKPFDTAHAQALEWEQEADRYNFVVVAPDLKAPDVLRQFPVRKMDPSIESDERTTLAVIEHVFATTHADRGNVLATSWSSGGYIAHFMFNRHPERFTCLAVRQSNFSSQILDAYQVSRSRNYPVLILTTQNDLGNVKQETKEAIQWYDQHAYSNLAWVEMKGLGHERTPDLAAAFFAQVAGVEPNRPPVVLVNRQAIAGNPRGIAVLAGRMGPLKPAQSASPPLASAVPSRTTPARSAPAGNWPNYESPPLLSVHSLPHTEAAPPPQASSVARTPARLPEAPTVLPRAPVTIRVSSAIGTEPLVLAFSADCPADWQRSADFLWTLNGDPICSGVNGQKTITEPGEHTLGLLVVTPTGQESRAYRLIRVLPSVESGRQAASAGSS
jgi:poly(3-hydroxybutyrate) depolymerase